MRSPRIVVAVLALALATSAGLSPTSASARADRPGAQAGAAADRVAGLAGPVSSRSAERAAPIEITARVVKRRLRPGGPRRLVLTGTVTPRGGPVYIQRGTKCSRQRETCNFKFYSKRFLKDGRYVAPIDAPPRLRGWVWRAKVKNSYSDVWVTCTKRPKQECEVPF